MLEFALLKQRVVTDRNKAIQWCIYKYTPHKHKCVCVCVCSHVLSHFNCIWLFVTLWTAALQAPPSMGFSRKKNTWSGLSYPPPGDLPNLGIQPASLMSPALAGNFFTTSPIWKTDALKIYTYMYVLYTYIPVCALSFHFIQVFW